MALDSTRRAWADLAESVRTGRSGFERVNGSSVWDWFAAHPEEEQLFAAAMRSITEFDGPALARSGLVPDEGVVCDVAGGAGTLLGDVLMLTQCVDGRERSLSELQALLSGAGFTPGRTARAAVSALIEGVAA